MLAFIPSSYFKCSGPISYRAKVVAFISKAQVVSSSLSVIISLIFMSGSIIHLD